MGQSFSPSSGTQYNTTPLNNFPSDLIGRSLVSFGKRTFDDTLSSKYDYFKLGDNKPDDFQKEAGKAIHSGTNVIVAAPTGMGKTAIAYYTASYNMARGKRTFYTAPLKALSNQKIREFQKRFGKENVGILTGDIKINPDAPIVIMTTEIYTNMLIEERLKPHAGKSSLHNLGSVIFDEMHYLNDAERGKVWELAMILTPPNIQQVSLSATIGNPDQVVNWQNAARFPAKTSLVNVSNKKRQVPLKDFYLRSVKSDLGQIPSDGSFMDMVKELRVKNRVPAIFFIPSKKDNRHLVWLFSKGEEGDALDLTTTSEKAQLQKVIDKNPALASSINLKALKRGYAMHNAGLLPETKEIIEELFQKKLIKVVFSTETLSAGINMPAKAVVLTSTEKPTTAREANVGEHRREFTSSELKQMAGRAGRRGLDKEGFVYFMYTNSAQREKFKQLYKASAMPLNSKLKFDYSFIAGCMAAPKGEALLAEITEKTLGSYTGGKGRIAENKKALMETVNDKKQRMKEYGFIADNGTLTLKGKLLARMSGYEQIPIVNIIYERLFTGMGAVELASSVGMLANASEKVANILERDKKQKFDVESDFAEIQSKDRDGQITSVINTIIDRFTRYNNKMYSYSEYYPVGVDTRTANHLWTWADLNNTRPVGTILDNGADNPNWQIFFEKFHPRIGAQELADNQNDHNSSIYVKKGLKRMRYEEGHLFSEIAQTIDLLKQIDKMCQYAGSLEEVVNKNYYQNLGKTAREAIKLLSHGPCLHV